MGVLSPKRPTVEFQKIEKKFGSADAPLLPVDSNISVPPPPCRMLFPTGGPAAGWGNKTGEDFDWEDSNHCVLRIAIFSGGIVAGRHLATCSKTLAGAVRDVWPDLARKFPDRLYVVGGIDSSFRPLASVVRFDPTSGDWQATQPLPSSRAAPAAIALCGKLYVLGGEVNGKALRDALRFDPWLGTWEHLPSMKSGRIRASCAVTDDCIYVLGGLDGTRPMRSVERYNPRQREWQKLQPMHCARYACSTCIRDGYLYAIGGELTDTGVIGSSERYDPQTDTWEMLATVQTPSCGASMAVVGNSVFVVGGLGVNGHPLRCIDRISLDSLSTAPQSGWAVRWEGSPPMITPRHLAAVTSYCTGICVVGGKGPTFDALCESELFDVSTQRWLSLPNLPAPQLRAGVASGQL